MTARTAVSPHAERELSPARVAAQHRRREALDYFPTNLNFSRGRGVRMPLFLALVASLGLAAVSALAQGVPSDAVEHPQLNAKLYAAQTSVVPGSETELAIEIKVPDDWHIYHPIILGTGAPTTIEFDLPAGVTTGPLRFPTPDYDADDVGGLVIDYLGLEGRVVVLTTLKVAQEFKEQSIPIKADIFALVCKKSCVPGDAHAQLTLPVSSEPGKPAHEDLFKEARESLPSPIEKAEYLEGSRVVVSHKSLPIHEKAQLAVQLKVRAAHHIQDRDPGNENFFATRVFIEGRDGIKFGEQSWPQPHVRNTEALGEVREQSGTFEIRVPFEVIDDKFKTGPVRLRVLVDYQCCADSGSCFMPATAVGVAEFDVVAADAKAVLTDDPLFKDGVQIKEGARAGASSHNIWLVLLAAFVGGAILNVTPCVLPVISLKIFGFVQQAREDRGRIFRMGLVYAAGILASFAVLAALMLGAGVAWGGLMQRPAFLIGLAAVVFAFALSLLGVFEIRLPGAAENAAAGAASREGYAGAFMNGVFATLLATPCLAPLLGSAIGILTTQLPPAVGATGIMVAGLGLATPYVLLTAFPGWLRFLPKPGPWMVTFKQIVGFILVVVVLWLLSILITMVVDELLLSTLGLLCAVGLGCWQIGRITLSDSSGVTARKWATAVVLCAGGGWLSFFVFANRPSPIPWQKWEPGIADRLAAEGYTVYIDYTATWCLTCQSNKKLVLERSQVVSKFKELGVYPIKADFTEFDKRILEELKAHDRVGVPLNIIVPANKPGEHIVLPEVLTSSLVFDRLAKAGPSAQIPAFWEEEAEEQPVAHAAAVATP